MTERKAEILYVDDSPDDRLFARLDFERNDYPFALTVLESAHAALADLEDRLARGLALPVLLVADHYMPVTDGPDLLRLIRSNPKLATMDTAICSGSEDPADMRKAELAGARFVLGKPLDLDFCREMLAGGTRAPA